MTPQYLTNLNYHGERHHDDLILWIILFCAIAFNGFGVLIASPVEMLNGLVRIIATRDALLTDYICVGGAGAAFFDAGLLTVNV